MVIVMVIICSAYAIYYFLVALEEGLQQVELRSVVEIAVG